MTERRVLVLSPDFPPVAGGIQVLVHRIASGFERFRPRVITLDAPGAGAFDATGDLDVRRVVHSRRSRRLSVGALNAAAVREGLRFRPHVVLSAHIVTSPAAVTIRRLLNVPAVQYFHAKEIGAKPRLATFAIANADASIAISRYTLALALRRGGDAARVHRIPPGVDFPAHWARRDGGPPTIVTVARLEDRYKGHDVVMRALPLVRARLPAVRWVVIGDGPLRGGLQQLADAQGVRAHVHFAGAVDDAERDRWLQRAHVFTMPSRLPAGGFAGEGFGIVYLEANARGIPVVAGAVGGALDAVDDGTTGVLVDPTDHVEVAEALSGLLLDVNRARALGEAGRQRARGFAWPVIARRVEDLLYRVAAR